MAFLAVLLSAFFVIFPSQWRRLFVVEVPMDKADAIIVLRGESEARPREAARLYHAGVAPLVFVTGIGDAAATRKVLLSAGVPPDRPYSMEYLYSNNLIAIHKNRSNLSI